MYMWHSLMRHLGHAIAVPLVVAAWRGTSISRAFPTCLHGCVAGLVPCKLCLRNTILLGSFCLACLLQHLSCWEVALICDCRHHLEMCRTALPHSTICPAVPLSSSACNHCSWRSLSAWLVRGHEGLSGWNMVHGM